MRFFKKEKLSFNFILPILLVVSGAVVLFFSAHNFSKAINSNSWLPVLGEIIDLKTISTSSTRSKLVIKYKFNYGSNSYVGDNRRFSKLDFANALIDEEKKKFKIGSAVTIYINPENPNDSVIEKGLSFRNYLDASIGLFLFLLGASLPFVFSRWFKIEKV